MLLLIVLFCTMSFVLHVCLSELCMLCDTSISCFNTTSWGGVDSVMVLHNFFWGGRRRR